MTSIHSIPHNNNLNLYNFLNGQRSNDYTVQEELGFQTTGNIQALLNSNPNQLKHVYEGILFNPTNHTNDNENVLGKINATKKDWSPLRESQPKTPNVNLSYKPNSDLLPLYPNGVNNTVLGPTRDMMIDGTTSVTLAGISTFGLTGQGASILNNPYNDIGHELNPYGIATEFGTRVLSEGKYSCEDIGAGLNVPTLKTYPNNNGAFYAKPTQMDLNIPLYQTGDWTNEQYFPDNFFAEFNNSVGVGCAIPVKPIPHRGPHGPSPRPPHHGPSGPPRPPHHGPSGPPRPPHHGPSGPPRPVGPY